MRDTRRERERERERERQRHKQRHRHRHRQREKQAPCREPDMGLDPGTPGLHPGLKAGAKPLHHRGCPQKCYFKNNRTRREALVSSIGSPLFGQFAQGQQQIDNRLRLEPKFCCLSSLSYQYSYLLLVLGWILFPQSSYVEVLTPQYLRIWPYLEIGALQRYSSENEVIRVHSFFYFF